jgi:hypothetical protein
LSTRGRPCDTGKNGFNRSICASVRQNKSRMRHLADVTSDRVERAENKRINEVWAWLNRVLKKCRSHGLPDRKAGNFSACAQLAHPGRGHRPGHSATLIPGQPGAQNPRPTPAPPPAGASRPPGRALACRCAWTCRSTGNRLARAGKRTRFLVPPGGAIPFPRSVRFSQHAGCRIACSAPC